MEPKLPIDSDSSDPEYRQYIDAARQFRKQFNLKNIRIDLIHDTLILRLMMNYWKKRARCEIGT